MRRFAGRCTIGFLLPLWLALPAAAVVPGEVDFQGLLLDSGGAPVNGSIDFDFELFDAASGGSSLWSESHTGVQVVDGVYDVTLGSVTPLTPALFAGGAVHLEITVGGETLSPRERLVAVPYALQSAVAETADSVSGLSGLFVSQLFEHVSFDGGDPPNTDPSEGTGDADNDGTPNFLDSDNDGDGMSDVDELAAGTDINLPTPIVDAFSPPDADSWITSTVQVQGQNFQPGLTVAFGSESPTPTNVTSTSFDVDVGPQGVGNASVAVTNPNGESDSASFPFVAVTPMIASFSPAEIPANQSDTVLVTGQHFVSGITVSFGPENPTPANITPTSFEVFVGPQPEGFVPVVVNHPNGNASAPVNFQFHNLVERRVFTSSVSYQGGGVATSDSKCSTLASAAGLTGTYKAWISDSTTSPSTSFIHSTVPYERLDGVKVADDWADLVDGTLDAPIQADEFGAPATASVKTGTLADGTADPSGEFCWDGGATSMSGRSDQTDTDWSENSAHPCVAYLRLFCFEQ